MMKKFDYANVKLTHITITLENQSIVYLYGMLEVELVKVAEFFLIDFIILEMKEDDKNTVDSWKTFLSSK